MRFPLVKQVLERIRRRQILRRPVESITSKRIEGGRPGWAEDHLIRAMERRGLEVGEVNGHEFTFADRRKYEHPDPQWKSIRVTHPALTGRRLKELVLEAVREGRDAFYCENPGHHVETVVLSSKGDWKRFADGVFPLPHERNAILVVTHRYNIVG